MPLREARLKNSEFQIQTEQRAICAQHGAEFVATPNVAVSGFAVSTRGLIPVNGLRHPAAGETTGWFIWCGEQFSEAGEFFTPLCTSHIYEDLPEIAKLLGLPPGYRFLLTGEYLDVWYDELLLEV